MSDLAQRVLDYARRTREPWTATDVRAALEVEQGGQLVGLGTMHGLLWSMEQGGQLRSWWEPAHLAEQFGRPRRRYYWLEDREAATSLGQRGRREKETNRG